jgi:hypothetical protein
VNIADIHDDYGTALEQVITAKLEDRDWVEPAEPAAPTDLMPRWRSRCGAHSDGRPLPRRDTPPRTPPRRGRTRAGLGTAAGLANTALGAACIRGWRQS